MAMAPSASGNPEIVPFYPTPDRLETLFQDGLEKEPKFQEKVESLFDGQIEKWDRETISGLLRSEENQQSMADLILSRSDAIQLEHPDFDPQNVEGLREELNIVGDTLRSMDKWELAMTNGEAQTTPAQAEVKAEKKGILRRALGAVGRFAKRHKIVTALLATALVAGAVAGGFYLTGNWELFLTSPGLSKWLGSADAAGELIPPTPPTPPLPGGGMFEVPPPSSPPGLGTPT